MLRRLLPNLIFEGESIQVIIEDLKDPKTALGLLAHLNLERSLTDSKRLQGTKDWLEVRFSSGHSNDGRLYFCTKPGPIHVLVGKKQNQHEDIKFIKSSVAPRLNRTANKKI